MNKIFLTKHIAKDGKVTYLDYAYNPVALINNIETQQDLHYTTKIEIVEVEVTELKVAFTMYPGKKYAASAENGKLVVVTT